MLHIARVSFVSSCQKTAKTECGKTVTVASIAIHTDADCPACRAAAEDSFRGAELILKHAKEKGLDFSELEASIPGYRAAMYRTVVFL